MDLTSIVSSYGGSVLDILAERLTINGVNVQSAHLRPNDNPMNTKIDVTKGFCSLVCKNLMLTEHEIAPKDLIQSSSSNGWYRSIWGKRAPPAIVGSWWLCVLFNVPGGATYTACYRVPEERVTFPPVFLSSKTIMPLKRQIIFAAIKMRAVDSSHTVREDADEGSAEIDESEEEIVLELTKQAQSMIGPDGTAFGRGWIDIRLAVADAVESVSNKAEFLNNILSLMVNQGKVYISATTADGEERSVDGCMWECTKK